MAKMAGINEADGRIIKDLEGLLGKELPQVKELAWNRSGYVVDESGAVTGLSLADCDLGDAGLAAASQALAALTGLQSLNLGSNELTDVSALAALTGLQSLDLGGNRLTDVSALAALTGLQSLNLWYNKLTDVSALAALTGLQSLNLGVNQLTDVSALAALTGLQSLDLGGNRLTDVSALAALTGLQSLNLEVNKLTDVSALAALTGLQSLQLHNNGIKELPEWITQRGMEIYCDSSGHETGIDLENNPLETPPLEIVKQGRDAIRYYFGSLKAAKPEEVLRLYEAKLLVVGPGDVGKTFLSNRLISGEAPPTVTTPGIDIHKWMVDTKGIKGFRINLWDFGGQEIYHATHQFFLTKRSLYLFVWQARTDDDRTSFAYWLNVIRLLSDSAPVIMVMNKSDERRKAIDQAAIHKQFPNVIDFYEVSAKHNLGIQELRARVTEEVEKLEQIGTTLPKQWTDIRAQLEQMKQSGTNYIPFEQYLYICRYEHNLTDQQAGHLARYYHELGIILHFAENPVLKDIVFLNPEWATDAVYALTDYKPIKDKSGRFHFAELKAAWKDYPEDKYAALLELMIKFELCFNLEGTQDYIIPELLRPERCALEWSYQDNLHFQYKYDFMPAGIITRFMVRNHHLIKNDLYWKNGLVMEWEGTTALIETNEFEGKIDVWITGEDCKGMLGIIRCDIEHIHNTLNRPVVAERIPCICSECKRSTPPHFYNYHDLRTLLRKNVRTTRCMKSAEEISIDVLLGAYGMSGEEREREEKRGGTTYKFYGDYVVGKQNKAGDIRSGMVSIGDKNIFQMAKPLSKSGASKKRIPSIVWRVAGFFIAASLLALGVLYVPQWKVKAALFTGAVAASLSIIFSPKTWHRRTALCLLMLVGAAQFGFGLYGHLNPSPGASGGGYLVLSGPAVIVQVLIVLAAIIIYVTGEIFSKRNE